MQRIFRPVVALTRRWDFKRRILVIGSVFVLPLLIVTYQLDKQWRSEIWLTRQEIKGSECLKALLPLIQHIQQHLGISSKFLSGDLSAEAEMQQKQVEIAEDIKVVDAVMERQGDEFKVKDKWVAAKQEWQTLQAQIKQLSSKESVKRHKELVTKLLALLEEVSTNSKLGLDHELDSGSIANVLVKVFPIAREYVGRGRSTGISAMEDKQLTEAEREQLKAIYEIASMSMEQLMNGLKTAMTYNSSLANKIEPQVKDVEGKVFSFLRLMDSGLIQAPQISISPDDYFAAGSAAIDALFELAQSLSNELGNLLNTRTQALSRKRLIMLLLIFVLVALAFGLFIGFYIATTEGMKQVIDNSRKLSDEVFPKIVTALQQLSQGDLTYRVDITIPQVSLGNIDGTEETHLLQAAARLADNAQKMVDAYITSSQQLAQLITEISQVSNRLGEISTQMATATQQVSAAIAQIANSVQQSAQGATEQAASIARTQAAFEQLNRAVESIASGAQEQAKLVNDLANASEKIQQTLHSFTQVVSSGVSAASEAQKVAASNSQRLKQMLSAMDAIRNAVESARTQVESMNKLMADIGKIVNTIADIAQQTNLLALNAAIEAARAGEQGRGFSVVADEVRKLAERSAQATKEIADLIANVQQGAEESVKAMEATYKQVSESAAMVGEAEQALGNIVEAVRKVQEQSDELERARKEISQALEQVFSAVERLSTIAEQNAAATEELAATAADMNEQIRSVAAVSEQVSAAMEEVSAASEEVSAQASGLEENAQRLADIAVQLLSSMKQFKLSEAGLDLELAKSQHLRWKARLRGFLDGKETLTEQQVTSHRDCDLGKWLYSEGISRYGHLPEMQELERIHAELHDTVRRVVQLHRSGQKDSANRELMKIEPISQRIIQLLTHLENLISGSAIPASVTRREGDGYSVRELVSR